MKRRVKVPVVQARAMPSPAGVVDAVAYRCLVAIIDNVRFLKYDMNPKNKAVSTLGEEADYLTADEIQALLDALMRSMLSRMDAIAEGGSSAYYDGKNSINLDGQFFELENDEETPGNDKVYGTNGSGTRAWKDDPAGLGLSIVNFGYSISGSTLTVNAGNVIFSQAEYAAASDDFALSTGQTRYIYLAHEVDHSATTISSSATEPSNTADQYRIKLLKTVDLAVTQIYRFGDIEFETPLTS